MAVVIVYLFKNESNRYTNLEKSIAVLPFRNDSSDDSTQYFMDGVMEELLTNLQTIKDLRVISRTSVEQYRDQNKPIPEIAQELNVNYIVEESGQKSGNTLRLRMQLIRAKKESHIWAKSFNSESLTVEEYFSAQSQFAEEIARELNTALTEKEKNLIEQLPSTNLEAYEAYLKGVFYSQNINQNNLDISQKQFELAIEIDPGFAYAYTGIAGIWLVRQQMGFTIPEEAGPKAMEAILKAAELDSNIAEVHFMQACINYLGVWDWKTSESEFLKALEINPNHAEAHGLYAQLLYILGRPKEAIKHSELSFKLDPLNQLIKMWFGFNFLYEKRYDQTISIYREVLEIDPNNFAFYGGISEAFHLKGKYEEALESTKICYTNFYPDIDHVFDHYTKLGYPGVMNLEGDLLVKQSEKKYIIPSDIVFLYVMAGNKEKTLEWLEKGYELRDPLTPYIGRPFFTSLLLNEPRYQELLSKLNIPYYE
jgi:TolB-like protein